MNDKILAALKSTYGSKYDLSDKAWAGIAAMLAINVTDETQIQTIISNEGVVTALAGVQAYGDNRVETARIAKPNEPVKPAEAVQTPEPVKPAEATSVTDKLLQQLLEGQTALNSRLDGIEGAKVTDTRKSTLEAKLEKVPDTVKGPILAAFEYMTFKDAAAFDGWLTTLQPQIDKAIQTETDTKVDQVPLPINAGQKSGNDFADLMRSLHEPAKAEAVPAK